MSRTSVFLILLFIHGSFGQQPERMPGVLADSIMLEGKALLDCYQYCMAIDKMKQALSIERKLGRLENIATTLNMLGEIYHGLEYYDTAAAYFDSALVSARQNKARYLEGVIHNNIGRCSFVQGKYTQSLVNCDSALQIAIELNDLALKGRILCSIANTLAYSGRADSAFALADSSLVIARAIGDRKEEARALLTLARICHFTVEFERALAFCDTALAVARDIADLRSESAGLDLKGFFYCELSQYDKAMVCLDSCLKIDRNTMRRASVRTFLSLQMAHRAVAHWDEALAFCDSALAVARVTGDPRDITQCFLYFAVTFMDFDLFDKALIYFDSAYTIARETNDSLMVVWILGILGDTYLQMEQYDQALDYLAKAHAGAIKLKELVLETGMKCAIGKAYCGLGRYDAARNYLDSALSLAKQTKVAHHIGSCCEGLGSVYVELGYCDKALAYYDSALVAFEGFAYKIGQAVVLDYLGQVQEKIGDLERAIEYYESSIEIRESVRKQFKKDELERKYIEEQKDVYERLINLLIILKRYEEAFEYMERSRSQELRRTLEEQGVVAYDSSLKRILERIDFLDAEIQGLSARISNEQIAYKDLVPKMNELEGRRSQALLDLKAYHPELYNAMMPQIQTLEHVQVSIPKNTVFIEYMLAGDRYEVFLLSRDRFVVHQIEAERTVIDSIVLVLITDLRWFSGKDVIDAHLETLYRMLLTPVETELERFSDIVIIPYGVLHYVPFHALRHRNAAGVFEYLTQRTRISYLPSALYLADLGEKKPRPKKELLALANCDGTLPSADIEVDSICCVFPGAYVCRGDSATKERLIGCCGDYRMIHLATHGVLDSDPRFSHIVLAPPDKGNLTVREIMGLHGKFERTSLITLSACETAVEEEPSEAGMELTTLSNAFKVAGVPTIVATLWEIADRSTAVLMKHFYYQIKKGHSDKIESLRQAQIALMTTPEYSHPYYWAPFVLIGDWR